MQHKYKFSIPQELNSYRVDKAINALCNDWSRNQIQKAIKNQKLTINGEIICNLAHKVKENDKIEIVIVEETLQTVQEHNIPIEIIYEDQDLMVINKSANMTVHPGAGNHSNTLVNALLYYTKSLSDIGGDIRPGIVHRLDKDTSGLMVVAKNNYSHRSLAEQIADRSLTRKYKALVWGLVKPTSGTISTLIGRHKTDRKKMSVLKSGGKTAITHYNTVEILCNGVFSLIECKLETGRTHQIRVHLSNMGHSIVGDQVYGNNCRKISSYLIQDSLKEAVTQMKRQALHSYFLSFIHPKTGNQITFENEPPVEYTNLLNSLKSV